MHRQTHSASASTATAITLAIALSLQGAATAQQTAPAGPAQPPAGKGGPPGVSNAPGATLEELSRAAWVELLARTKLQAHRRHFFARELQQTGPVSHVRLNIFPDGGVSRFRVHGTLATP